ncbi:MAG: hypothetical protein K0Q65_442 [Clostridia bacterium]|jgi:hypothetical protein|nr:hypothetical protein [Clostridia bacterium]
MAFKVNTGDIYEGNQNNGPMPEGDYEVVIKEVKEDKANTGTPYINVELVVRNDVDQTYKNKHLWYTIWASKDTGEYNAKGINTLSKHAGLSNGAQFNSVAEWGKFLFNKPILATIKHEDYNGKTRERVAFVGASKSPQCNHQWAAPSSNAAPAANNTTAKQNNKPAPTPRQTSLNDDDDLPF